MNSTRIYIHIGTHKTGSTSIQHALRKNFTSLHSDGIVYLPIPENFKSLMYVTKVDEKIVSKCGKILNKRMNSYKKKGYNKFLLSWEGFSGNPMDGYANAKFVAKNLREITLGLEAYIIVYLRSQDLFIESLYTQKIMEGESWDFDTFIEMIPSKEYDWERLLYNYSECFGKNNIIARKYDKNNLIGKDALIKDFESIIGSKCLCTNQKISVKNRGYSRDALEIARITNPYLNEYEKKSLRHILQDNNYKIPFENYSFWTDEKRTELLANYLNTNFNIAREYFNDSTGMLFSVESPNVKQDYKGISVENVAIILTKIIFSHRNEALSPRIKQKLIKLLNKFPNVKSQLKNIMYKLGYCV